MSEEQLAEIEATEKAVTPGPWEHGVNPKGEFTNEMVVRPAGEFPHGEWICDCGSQYDQERIFNAVFIARAREDIPALVAEVRRLQKERAALVGMCREAGRLIRYIGSPFADEPNYRTSAQYWLAEWKEKQAE